MIGSIILSLLKIGIALIPMTMRRVVVYRFLRRVLVLARSSTSTSRPARFKITLLLIALSSLRRLTTRELGLRTSQKVMSLLLRWVSSQASGSSVVVLSSFFL